MCGRFLLSTPAEAVAEAFGIGRTPPALKPRYNIAPTQMVPIVRAETQGKKKVRTLTLVRWGLVPFWADDPAIGNRLINARAETADTKPAFRAAFKARRCLVPADGFYEWKKIDPKSKQPMLIRPVDGRPLAMAGLWERWKPRDPAAGEEPEILETCTILTCEPSELLAEVHDRMPVILEPVSFDRWLDPDAKDPAGLKDLMVPLPAGRLRMDPVGRYVNSPAHDTPECAKTIHPGRKRSEDPGLFM